jgi:hypothetical protein
MKFFEAIETPIPEPDWMIDLQARVAALPASPKAAVLITPGTRRASDPARWYGLVKRQTSLGELWVNPAKHDPDKAVELVETMRHGKLLGYSQETKPLHGQWIVRSLLEGLPVTEELTGESQAQKAIEAAARMFPGARWEVVHWTRCIVDRLKGLHKEGMKALKEIDQFERQA